MDLITKFKSKQTLNDKEIINQRIRELPVKRYSPHSNEQSCQLPGANALKCRTFIQCFSDHIQPPLPNRAALKPYLQMKESHDER